MRDFVANLRAGIKPHLTWKLPDRALTEAGTLSHVHHGHDGDDSGLLPGRGARLRSQLCGALILLATTVLWASGGPTTKYLFLLPAPPSAALLTACISVITALFLGVGLLGSAMEVGGGVGPPTRRRRRGTSGGGYGSSSGGGGAAVQPGSTSAVSVAAAATAAEAAAADVDVDEEAEAEALLHSGMHTTGGSAGGALAAACAAAREAAQREREREQLAWARAQECSLPLLTSHRSSYYYCSSMASYSQPSREMGREDPAMAMGATAAAAETISGRGSGGGGGDSGVVRLHDGSPSAPVRPRRGPSVDGVTASPPPPPPLWPHDSGSTAASDPGAPRCSSEGEGGPPRKRGAGGCDGASNEHIWRLRLLTASAPNLLAAGLELGIYNVTAAALGAWGMQRISATRSAFLAQATSLLTPLLVWLSGGRVGLIVWIACCCGGLGGAMVALDNVYGSTANGGGTGGGGGTRHLLALLGGAAAGLPTSVGNSGRPVVAVAAAAGFSDGGHRELLAADSAVAATAAPSSSGVAAAAAAGGRWQVEGVLLTRQAMGAAYVLLSCVFWGLGTVRLGVHSARYPPLHLAAAAALSYAGLSLLWLSWEIVGSPSAGLSDFLELSLLLRNHVTASLLLWAGLGPGALSSYLQVLGQQTVPPAQAQVLFSSTPLWSALLAQQLLPGEAMGPLAWLGGAIMLGASLLASLWQ